MALPSVATENENTDISEPSSIKPFQTVKLMSDLEFSDAPLELANNVKLTLSAQESEDALDNDIKSLNNDKSSAEEVQTLDEISEEIEEDLSENLQSHTKDKSHRLKDSQKSEENTYNEADQTISKNPCHRSSTPNKRRSKSRPDSKHSTTSSKSRHNSRHTSEHSSAETTRKHTRTHSRRSKSGSTRHSHKTDAYSKKSDDSYTSDFSESSKQTETASSKKSSLFNEPADSSKIVKSNADISKKTSKVTSTILDQYASYTCLNTSH